MNQQATPAIELDRLTVRYGERMALDGVSVRIEPGSYVGIVGPNGSGKSTLLRAILGIVPTADGEVRIGGQGAHGRQALAYVPQRHEVGWEFPLTVWDVVMMARLRGLWRRPGRRDREAVAWALGRVDLLDRRRSLIGELSGGQQQRAFIARALAQQRPILLLDEPLTGVDAGTMDLILTLLAEMHEEGRTILITTHDLNTTADTCDTLMLLSTRLIAYGPMDEIFTQDMLRETFGRHVHFADTPEGGHHETIEHVIHH